MAVISQNLVNNFSFEVYDTCPNGEAQVSHAIGWNINGIHNTPDYYNSCSIYNWSVPSNLSGYQSAYAGGNAYCGFYTYFPLNPPYREYTGTQLETPLNIGTKYFVSFYVSLADEASCGTDKIGILFSINPYYFDAVSPTYVNMAQIFTQNIIIDTLNWVKISGFFIADSSYKYISIGNFFDNANTDTTIWIGTNCVAYYYLDNVCVSTDSLTCNPPDFIEENINLKEFKIYPNPSNNFFNIICNNSFINQVSYNIYNIYGNLLKEGNIDLPGKINISDFENGIYILQINADTFLINKQIIIIKH